MKTLFSSSIKSCPSIIFALLLFLSSLSLTCFAYMETNTLPAAENCLSGVFLQHSLTGKSVGINKCGVKINNKKAHLEKDIECTVKDLKKTGAAILLKNASLDLNGKSIRFKEEKPEGMGILIDQNAEVFDSTNTSKITGFRTGIALFGDNAQLCNISVENTLYGITIEGNHNQLAQIKVAHIGGIINETTDLLVTEGKALTVQGNYNQLLNNTIHNIAYSSANKSINNSMFAYAIGIDVLGNHNLIAYNNIANVSAVAHAIYNAQSSAIGIRVEGQKNRIESSKIYKIAGAGFRKSPIGNPTGAKAFGVQLTNAPDLQGNNHLNNSEIRDITARGEKSGENFSAKDITAEAYGIQALHARQKITHTSVEEVDAFAEFIQIATGIRVVDKNHYIANNMARNNGLRMLENNPDGLSLVMGISIDSINSRIENNQVENNNGIGITTGINGIVNIINYNNSTHNTGYDFLDQNAQNQLEATSYCNNNWNNNFLENATFYPEYCFL